jgi:hypothetical protein
MKFEMLFVCVREGDGVRRCALVKDCVVVRECVLRICEAKEFKGGARMVQVKPGIVSKTDNVARS